MNTHDTDLEVTHPQREALAGIAEKVLLKGDLSELAPRERVFYYLETCRSLGLNPYTKPFDYIETDGGLKLYPNKDCAAQLRARYGISLRIVSREMTGNVYVVTTHASTPDGRVDESIGAVPMLKELGEWQTAKSGKKYFQPNGQTKPLNPEAQANAVMRAETKSKRRATLSICGLGMFDRPEGDEGARWDVDLGDGPVPVAGSTSEGQRQTDSSGPSPTPPPAQPVSTGDPELDRELAQFGGLTREGRLAKFASLKHDLQQLYGDEGAVRYYTALKAHGDVEHAWQLGNMRQAKAVLVALWSLLRDGVPIPAEEPAS